MKSLRILVIDDEKVICDACQMILSEEGYEVHLRTSGENGLNAIRTGSYNLVLLDIKLPDIDGMEIIKTIREEKPEMCIMVMTGYATMGNAIQAMKLGAIEYLAKPFTDHDLIDAVQKVIENKIQKRKETSL